MKNHINEHNIDRIVEMAWEDRTPFEAIKAQFKMDEKNVIVLMRGVLKPKSFKRWRARVQGRKTKHLQLRPFEYGRFKCSRQKQISNNRIAKRI